MAREEDFGKTQGAFPQKFAGGGLVLPLLQTRTVAGNLGVETLFPQGF